MIQIRKIQDADRNNCEELLKECALNYDELIESMHAFFVVDDGKDLIGICAFVIRLDETAQIDCLFIKRGSRNMKLGDGLMRGTLNYLDQLNVKTVFIHSNSETHAFYMKQNLSVLATDYTNSDQLIFKVDLPDFFQTPCKGSGLKI